MHGNRGNILFLPTGGGNKETGASMSLVKAALVAKNGLKVISLIGKSGGVLKDISDFFIHVESHTTSRFRRPIFLFTLHMKLRGYKLKCLI